MSSGPRSKNANRGRAASSCHHQVCRRSSRGRRNHCRSRRHRRRVATGAGPTQGRSPTSGAEPQGWPAEDPRGGRRSGRRGRRRKGRRPGRTRRSELARRAHLVPSTPGTVVSALAVLPDGDHVVVLRRPGTDIAAAAGCGAVSEIDLRSGASTGLGDAVSFALSPDGAQVAIVRSNDRAWNCTGGSTSNGAVAPQSNVVVRKLSDDGSQSFALGTGLAGGAAFSPDGHELAVSLCVQESCEVRIVGVDSSGALTSRTRWPIVVNPASEAAVYAPRITWTAREYRSSRCLSPAATRHRCGSSIPPAVSTVTSPTPSRTRHHVPWRSPVSHRSFGHRPAPCRGLDVRAPTSARTYCDDERRDAAARSRAPSRRLRSHIASSSTQAVIIQHNHSGGRASLMSVALEPRRVERREASHACKTRHRGGASSLRCPTKSFAQVSFSRVMRALVTIISLVAPLQRRRLRLPVLRPRSPPPRFREAHVRPTILDVAER